MVAYGVFAIAEEEDTHEPITFQEAINSCEKDEWVRAIEEEMSSLKKNHTWELVDQPPGRKLVSCKWLYKIKERTECIQKPRVILSLTACEDYELEQLDVKTAFLHGNLEETIYMRQPPGFEEGTGNKSQVFTSRSLHQSEIKYTNGLLRKEFDMKELGPARKILGMEIVMDRGSQTLKVSQSGYVQKILNNFRVDNGKSVSMPLGAYFKVSLKDCPSSDWDVERMSKVPHANVVVNINKRDVTEFFKMNWITNLSDESNKRGVGSRWHLFSVKELGHKLSDIKSRSVWFRPEEFEIGGKEAIDSHEVGISL
ncbi:retrotransposon protein, putative, ty1-copia subclass [Tanacetum coccineum]